MLNDDIIPLLGDYASDVELCDLKLTGDVRCY